MLHEFIIGAVYGNLQACNSGLSLVCGLSCNGAILLLSGRSSAHKFTAWQHDERHGNGASACTDINCIRTLRHAVRPCYRSTWWKTRNEVWTPENDATPCLRQPLHRIRHQHIGVTLMPCLHRPRSPKRLT